MAITSDEIAAFYSESHTAFSKYFTKVIGFPDLTPDLINSLFVRLLRRAHSITDIKPYAWITARNLISDLFRSQAWRNKTVTYIEGVSYDHSSHQDIIAELMDCTANPEDL